MSNSDVSDAATIATPQLPRPGRAPTAPPAAAAVGIAAAIALLTGGVILLRDAVVHVGWLGGSPWVGPLIERLDGLQFQWPLIPTAAVTGAIGFWLIWIGLRPRHTTAIAVSAPTSVWLRPQDLGRVVSYAAGSVPGVTAVRCKVARRKVIVVAQVDDLTPVTQIRGDLTTAATQAVRILAKPPRISVQLKELKAGDHG